MMQAIQEQGVCKHESKGFFIMATDRDETIIAITWKPGHTNVCILSIADDRCQIIETVMECYDMECCDGKKHVHAH